MRKSLSYFLFSLLLLLYSCDVGLHDNFVEIEPLPTETLIYVNLDAKSNDEGVLQVFENTSIHYQISTPEAKFLRASFYVNGTHVYETTNPEGNFSPFYYSIPKKIGITCVVSAEPKKLGHSISDQASTRIYEAEIKWNAHVVTPELHFYQKPGDITPENITVRWETNVPNCSFRVYNEGVIIASNTKENSISVPTPPFGRYRSLKVEVFNQNGEGIYFSDYATNYFSVTFGTVLKGGQMISLYSPYSNTLYACTGGEVTSYSIPELAMINEYKNEDSYSSYVNSGAVSPNSNKIAVSYSNFVRIFTNSDLIQQIKIYSPDDMSYMPYKTILTTDDKLAIYYNDYYSPKIYLYSASNGKLEKSISISTPLLDKYYPDFTNCQMSEQFLCVPLQSTHKIAIIPLQDFQTGEPAIYDWSFKQIFMYPNSSDKLILDKTNQVDVIDCQNGQIVQSVSKDSNWILCSIDSKTGNYLFRSSHYLIIKDINGEELLQLEIVDGVTYPSLNNNILTCQEGIALNVEPYLKKK